MEEYLEPLDSRPLISSSFILKYDRGKYLNFNCKDYENFNSFLAESLVTTNVENQYLYYDCIRTPYHSLIFDIDIYNAKENRINSLLRYFDSVFLKAFKKHLNLSETTFILAMPKNRLGGMHVHIPGFAIAHDDYVHLCKLMSNECNYKEIDGTCFRLGCPSSFCLVASAKPKNDSNGIYIPVRFVDVKYSFYFWRRIEITDVTFNDSSKDIKSIIEMMTPIPKKEWKVLFYPTRIILCEENDYHFVSCLNNCKYRIYKSDKLKIGDLQQDGSYLMNFLKIHAKSIIPFSHLNRVAKTWYKRFTFQHERDNDIFTTVNTKLRRYCIHLRDEINPLQTILLNEESIIPVFFALCNEMKRKTKTEIINSLIKLNGHCGKILINHPLVKTNQKPPFHLTFNTILNCAFHTVPMKTKQGFFSIYIGMGWDWIFENTTTIQEIAEYIKIIQKLYFPMVKRDEDFYVWNPIGERWEIMNDDKCLNVFQDIYTLLIFYFEGSSKLSHELLTKLKNETQLIKNIARNKMKDLQCNNDLTIAAPRTIQNEMSKLYGRNVPEYYMLDLDIESSDETDNTN